MWKREKFLAHTGNQTYTSAVRALSLVTLHTELVCTRNNMENKKGTKILKFWVATPCSLVYIDYNTRRSIQECNFDTDMRISDIKRHF
jgi:hypothetical protein